MASSTPTENGVTECTDEELHNPVLLKAKLLIMEEERRSLNEKLETAVTFLLSTPAGLTDPLVDAEGFPRNDCDLYAIRGARESVARTRNDIRALEERLHRYLQVLHELTAEEAKEDMRVQAELARHQRAMASATTSPVPASLADARPLLHVVTVEHGSPAQECGLRAGHIILQYGGINANNLSARGGWPSISQLTASSEGQSISVWVNTGETVEEIILVPQVWSGNGLVGCELAPA